MFVWQSIIVRWDPLPEEVTNGIITGYRIRYRQNKDRRQTIVAVDGSQAQCILASKFSTSACRIDWLSLMSHSVQK